MTGAVAVPTEDDEQKILAQWLDAKGILWCHVPNEAKRSYRTASRYKAVGMKSGVPDLLIFTRPPNKPASSGAAIELKRCKPLGRKPSPNQIEWLRKLQNNGWLTVCCYGADEAINWLVSHGY